MFLAAGHSSDPPNQVTLTPEEARLLADDLIRAADESEDHMNICEISIMTLARKSLDSTLNIKVNPVNPNRRREGG